MVNTTSTVKTLDFASLVSLLDGNNCCRFISLLYRAKGTGELARHTLMLNVKRENCLKDDLAHLQAQLPKLQAEHIKCVLLGKGAATAEIAVQACQELIESIQDSLAGNNPRYTKTGYYENQGNKRNAKVSVKDVCYVQGYSIGKIVIEPGEYKKVNSAALTIAKEKLRKQLRNTRIREFILKEENFVMANRDGKTLVIDASGSALNKLVNLPPVTLAVPVAPVPA